MTHFRPNVRDIEFNLSRSSVLTDCSTTAVTAISTPRRCATSSKRLSALPKAHWPNPTCRPTDTRSGSTPPPTRSSSPIRCANRFSHSKRQAGGGWVFPRTSGARSRRCRWCGRSGRSCTQPTCPRPSSTSGRRWRPPCGRSARPNNGVGPPSPWSGVGREPWCSRNRTPAPTSAPGSPKQSNSRTGPGTSPASNASSPAAT